MHILANYPLVAALLGIIIAQTIKVPIRLIITKEFKPGLAFSTGGMPSSHSAAVAALTTGIGMLEGIQSPLFAAACIFSVIVMFDASGIRRQAGEQAVIINQLINDFQDFVEGTKDWKDKKEDEKRQELKEIMGHQPIEVFVGALLGLLIAFLLYRFYS
ncbi:divergent PAP2 family protein [Virgibacillus sp. MSJ-26]|uniref:divergent PAP2 family protein n=1 Tax=Virgibacillus sp. MSJ-26 TaxID=2841522 RepID=UPI001C122236|nr:divergent PAP2 family protein [Virgibacillus sp. MSJ-26]MBU5467226.1 divergent PAP2 family protein [Virgibacillus sp. MSJ-26]